MPLRFICTDRGVQLADQGAIGLRALVITRSLRYWLLASWALLLGLTTSWGAALGWLFMGASVGVIRGRHEAALARRSAAPTGGELTGIATVTSLVWAAAPALAWLHQAPASRLAAMAMLAAGGVLVVTQFRHLPKSAIIVGSPYGAVMLWVITSSWGEPFFWPSLAVALVLNSALATNVFFTRVHKAQIEAFRAQQARLISELEVARDKANAASAAKSNFLSIISHELRTPMNGVLGAAQLLNDMPMKKDAHDLVAVIRESGEDLLALLNDVLDFAKIEQGRLDLDQEPVDLRALLDRMVTLWAPTAADRRLRLRLEASAAPMLIMGDRLRIGQILNNLISNAVKFSSDGEVVIGLATETGADNAADLVLTVADCGPGIALRDRARLFRAFSQLDESITRRHAGAGLGLAISKRLAQIMGGDLQIDDDYVRGACFRLSWRAELADTGSSQVGLHAEQPAKPLTVLVVEDHPVNQQILQLWLTAQGHCCATASNGQEALDIASTQRFDLVLMDVNMPVMDGLKRRPPGKGLLAGQEPQPLLKLTISLRHQPSLFGISGLNLRPTVCKGLPFLGRIVTHRRRAIPAAL